MEISCLQSENNFPISQMGSICFSSLVFDTFVINKATGGSIRDSMIISSDDLV